MEEDIIKELKKRYEIDKETLAADQLRVLLDYEIARNKEVEKIVDTLNYGIKNHFIPKSKIKEKIKELNEDMLNENESIEQFYKLKFCYEILQELLEE